jgi:hypothetical protein
MKTRLYGLPRRLADGLYIPWGGSRCPSSTTSWAAESSRGFWDDTTALVFYLIVGADGLVATLATRFGPRMPAVSDMMLRRAP